MSIESLSHEAVPNEPFLRVDLQPYEIKSRDGKFVVRLPVTGGLDAKGKPCADEYGEVIFDSEEKAYRAVAEARKDFELNPLN